MARRSESKTAARDDAIREFVEAAEENHKAYTRFAQARVAASMLGIEKNEIYAAWDDVLKGRRLGGDR